MMRVFDRTFAKLILCTLVEIKLYFSSNLSYDSDTLRFLGDSVFVKLHFYLWEYLFAILPIKQLLKNFKYIKCAYKFYIQTSRNFCKPKKWERIFYYFYVRNHDNLDFLILLRR